MESALHNALNILEFNFKLCLEFFSILPLIKDNLSTKNKQLIPKLSTLWRFHFSLNSTCSYKIFKS